MERSGESAPPSVIIPTVLGTLSVLQLRRQIMSFICKQFFFFALFLALPLSLFACKNENAAPVFKPSDEPASPSVEMEGTVTETGERLLVEVTKSEYTSGPHIVLLNEDTVITDADGDPLSAKDVKVGDCLKILYSGQVMLSYPPKIVALHIVVK